MQIPKQSVSFDDLPNEIIEMIVYLTDEPIITRSVCKLWKAYSKKVLSRDKKRFIVNSIAGGHLNILKWAKKNIGYKIGKKSTECYWAAKFGQLEILKWARQCGCNWNEDTCSIAAFNGHLHVIKWARGFKFGSDLITKCSPREDICPWDSKTCESAARNGQLHVLKWARQHGCHWNENTCASAAVGGHLDILKWLRKNGCPWDEWTLFYVPEEQYPEIFNWAKENGCPGDGSLPYNKVTGHLF